MRRTSIAAIAVLGGLVAGNGLAAAQQQSTAEQSTLYQRILTSLQCKEGQACQPAASRKRGFRTGGGDIPQSFDLTTDGGRRSLEAAAKRGLTPTLDIEVYFPYNSADLTAETRKKLDEVGTAFRERTMAGYRFAIVGHTDAAGGETFNMSLSERRAAAVRDYLVQSASVDGGRLTAWGRGEAELKSPGDPLSAVNRRVQLINSGASETAAVTPRPATGEVPSAPAATAEPPAPAVAAPAPSTARPASAADAECRRYSPTANKVISCAE